MCLYVCTTVSLIYKCTDMEVQIINRFYFNVEGINIAYNYKGKTTHLQLCPKATCQLLEDAGMIEGFDIDENGEPVILFTDDHVRTQYGFDRWNSFVCTFPLSYRMAVKLLEYREARKDHFEFQELISELLLPLQAA